MRRINPRGRRGGGHAVEDDPSKIFGSGLKLWLRSDLGVTLVGSKVSAWADQSGNANHATQGTDAKRPTYTTGSATFRGYPRIDFGGAQMMTIPHHASLGPSANGLALVMVVFTPPSSGNRTFFSKWYDSGPGNYTYCMWQRLGGSALPRWRMTDGSALPNYSIDWGSSLLDGTHIIEAQCNGTNTAALSIDAGTTLMDTRVGFLDESPDVEIAANTNTLEYGHFYCAEIILADHIMTADEGTRLYAYIESRYDVL